jgi:hypothetical protein
MPDPVVHITNGIPDSGTGNITTLGQTLTDGANLTLGVTTDAAVTAGAAGTINAHLRSISRDVVGGIVLQTGANVIGAVTQSAGPWSVSGTFWQATQPISAVSLPLPTGAATAVNQSPPLAQGSTTSGQGGGLAMGAVTTGAPGYTTAQTSPLSLTTVGNLRVDGSSVTQPVSLTSTTITGTVAVTESGVWTVDPTTIGTWGLAASTQNVARPTNGGLVMGQFNTSPAVITSGNVSPLQLDTNGNLKVNSAVRGWSLSTVSDTVNVQQSVASLLNASVGGDTAPGTSDANNPVKIGGVARTANPAAVTTGQRVNATFDKLGKLIAVGAIRDLKGIQKTSITVNTETIVLTAGGAGVFNDVYAIVVTNKSATDVFVDFRDASAGTVRMTLAVPAGDTRGFTVAVDSAMVQAVAANNWTATVSSAVISIEISMLYVSNL